MSGTASLLAERLLELVRIPSPSRREERLAVHVEEFLDARTRPASLLRRGSAVTARYGWDRPGPKLGLIGHLDTVPEAGHPEPAIAGDRVIGLGTSDMKGGLAVMMTLGERYPEGAAPTALVFYDREEVGYDENGLGPLFSTEPWLAELDLAVLMEPTDNYLELGCLGNLHARVSFRGVAAHSARPWLGENAIHRAAPFLARLAGTPPREYAEGSAVYREVVSATMAEGGIGRNVVPDRFTVTVNLRFAPDRSLEDAERYLRSLLPEGVEVEITDRAPAAPSRADSPHVERLRRDFGLAARAKQAWTDVARFSALGIPAVNFGPGLPELAHKRDEYVPVANLERSFDVLEGFLRIRGGESR